MAYRGSVWRDLAAATPVAAGVGVVDDFAETHVNPSFVGATVAPLGWGIALGELALGLVGAGLASTTRDEMYFEALGEPLWVLGAKDTAKYATHYVRNRMNAKKAQPVQPAAPKQVLEVRRTATPAPQRLAEDF